MNDKSIKKYIKSYDIAKPDWSSFPAGFRSCDTNSFDKQEKILWEAINIAWIIEHPIDFIGEKIASGTIYSITFILISTVLLSFLYYADVNYNLGMKFLTDFFA